MWKLALASIVLVPLATACNTDDLDRAEPRSAPGPAPLASAPTDRPATAATAAVPAGSHRPGAPLDFAEAVDMLPHIEGATRVTAPRQLPQERIVAEYCHDTGRLAASAEALAETLRREWTDVSVQDVRDRRIIRADRGAYVLRATLAPGTKQGCSGPEAVLVRLVVFKPQGPGGLGAAASRG
jgi:hypothetical protein